jgi:hypothetical protein|tara:strand:+ start:364 stop:765 length:402 start_codon:yes stop_codon:yes gene_type:complete
MLKKLIALGFEKAGEWVLNDGDLELMINKHSEKNNILYSFVVDGEIKYIGKSISTLKKRMYGYHKPGNTQTTNIEKNDLIINSLKDGKIVEIFLWYDNDPKKYNNLIDINLAAGLEDSMIAEFVCEWNKIGRK